MNGGIDPRLVDRFVDLARQDGDTMSSAELDAGWRRLETGLDAGPALARGWFRGRWFRVLAMAGCAAVLTLAVQRLLTPERPLGYTVVGQATRDGQTLRSVGAGDTRLSFTDESQVTLGAVTRVQVVQVDERGAGIALLDGELEVSVRPHAHRAWRFQAGGFVVRVKGTSFHMGFHASEGRFSLHMKSGLVEVETPNQRDPIQVAAGGSLDLVLSPPRAERDLAGESPAGATTQSASPRAPVEVDTVPEARRPAGETPRRRAATREAASEAPSANDWVRLLAAGDFAAVVADAQRRGIDEVMAHASAADLTTLSDSARYTRQFDLARRALATVRSRFAGSDRARDAAFFLGRLAETPPGDNRAALEWYDKYLAEAPGGPYVAQAMGREMALLAKIDRPRARKLARLYLDRIAHGSDTDLAKYILESTAE